MTSPTPFIPPPRVGHVAVFIALAVPLVAMATSPSYQFSVNPLLAFLPLLVLVLVQAGFAMAYPGWANVVYGLGRFASVLVYTQLFWNLIRVERNGEDWVLLRPYLSVRRLWSDSSLWAAAQEWNLAHPYYVPLPPQRVAEAIAAADHSLVAFRQLYPDLVRQNQPLPVAPPSMSPSSGEWVAWISDHPFYLLGGSALLLVVGLAGVFAHQKGWLNFAEATTKFADSTTKTAKATTDSVASQAKALGDLGDLSKALVEQVKSLPPSVVSTDQLLTVYQSLAEFSLLSAKQILLLTANQSLIFDLLQEFPTDNPAYKIGDPLPPAPPDSIRGQTEFLKEVSQGLARLIRDLHVRLNIPLPRGLSNLDLSGFIPSGSAAPPSWEPFLVGAGFPSSATIFYRSVPSASAVPETGTIKIYAVVPPISPRWGEQLSTGWRGQSMHAG